MLLFENPFIIRAQSCVTNRLYGILGGGASDLTFFHLPEVGNQF